MLYGKAANSLFHKYVLLVNKALAYSKLPTVVIYAPFDKFFNAANISVIFTEWRFFF